MTQHTQSKPIRVLSLLEAESVGGPAKNLLEFSRCVQNTELYSAQLEIAPFHRLNPDNDFTRAAEAVHVPLHRIHERFAFDRSVIPQIREIIRKVQPDILQTHGVKSHFLLRLGGEWRHRHWIAFHHGYTMVNTKMVLYNQLDRWSLRKPERVVTVSENFAVQLTDTGVPSSKITVLHNAIDLAWGSQASAPHTRQQIRSALNISPQEKVILNVGRLSHEKSQAMLVEAFSQLRHLLPGQAVRLLIVGEGPERPAIEQAIRNTGVTGRVILAGYHRDVAPYYAAADIAVISSYTEGSPNALLEAMAARLPLVATTVGGIPEMVSSESAWLIPPRDASALGQALAQAVSQEQVAHTKAANAYEVLKQRFTPEARAQRLCQIYAEVCGGSVSAS